MPTYLVTGASRGIGLEFIRQLSAQPQNKVFALVRNKPGAAKLLALQSSAPNVQTVEADITDFNALKTAAEEVAQATGGKLDYLINNAAWVDEERPYVTLDNYDEQVLENDLKKAFEINVVGVVHTINAFLPLVRAGTAKTVVALSSGLADVDFTLVAENALGGSYSISKAALNMAVAKFAMRFKDEGMIFLTISPGLVSTSNKSPKPEDMEGLMRMLAAFKRAAPGWDGKPMTPEQSVTAMMRVIDELTIEDTGAFISHNGNKQWL